MITHSVARTIAMLSLALAMGSSPARAEAPLSTRSSFRVGTSGVACTAQNSPLDARIRGMFDRAYLLSCRDAAGSIGSLIAVRRPLAIESEASVLHEGRLPCQEATRAELEGLGEVASLTCRDPSSNLDYRRYGLVRDGVSYLVEGLAGYDPALRLALASVVRDRPQPGEIRVAATEVSDAAAFARVQAGLLETQAARDEAYTRNNAARFAEAAEFFETITTRETSERGARTEALINQGLQQSNLGNFTSAERLFAQAEAQVPRSDGVTQRLLRNYRAIDALNRRQSEEAVTHLDAPVAPVAPDHEQALREGLINLPLSDQINRENIVLQQLGGVDSSLNASERAEILDGQADALRGIALRQQGQFAQAGTLLQRGLQRISAVREGRVVSTSWLRSEIQMELALLAEAQGRREEAAAAFDRAIAIFAEALPDSPALLAAKARKAAFAARSGDEAGARALYEAVIEQSPSVSDSGSTLRDMLAPYFALLAKDGSRDAAAAMFQASQVLQRPGVAQTQAVLARELSDGNDEASALFRLSVARSRDVTRTQADIARLSALAEPTERDIENLNAARETLTSLQREQTELVSRLANYPRYKVLSPQTIDLAALQSGLQPDEAYYKLMIVSGEPYAMFVRANEARVFPIEGGLNGLADDVQVIRDSIVVTVNGQHVTEPFDVERARGLYQKLFGAIGGDMSSVRHLIFDPDGPMLQLPPYVLVQSDVGIEAYKARLADPNADAYDLREIEWLGRNREVSVSVSPQSFLDLRSLRRSNASRTYLGLGENAVPTQQPGVGVATECDWPLAVWQNPISSGELVFASSRLGGPTEVRTRERFSDSQLLSDSSLDEYRILHFATHGIVTPPRRDCPARPALVTSFGDSGSDGLLTFREIFDLNLDADLVILSACDTAGMATVSTSREAGISTGGDYALDGLVRAFVGAGARSVVASHWPVPDDYQATQRLIGGLLEAAPGERLSQLLARAQQGLMADANTSHPFYWAAFVIVGDGQKSLLPAETASTEVTVAAR